MTDEEKAEFIYETTEKIYCWLANNKPKIKQAIKEGLEKGLAEGRKEVEKKWHDCFLTCSSPYCAKQFPEVKMQGELGNMTKE